jgi:hypothetical protein
MEVYIFHRSSYSIQAYYIISYLIFFRYLRMKLPINVQSQNGSALQKLMLALAASSYIQFRLSVSRQIINFIIVIIII